MRESAGVSAVGHLHEVQLFMLGRSLGSSRSAAVRSERSFSCCWMGAGCSSFLPPPSQRPSGRHFSDAVTGSAYEALDCRCKQLWATTHVTCKR
jgi:hypothetical protein